MRLTCEALAFGYPRKPVGAGLSLTVTPGEVLVLLGPNGSGKTTLFKTMLGLIPAQGGTVRLDDRPLASLSRREVALQLGYVPQAFAGYFPFTVRETVLMGRTAHIGIFASPSSGDRAVADRMLEALGIAHLAEEPYTRISGGERQLTLIARALAQEPSLLVMDEPTASLDFGNAVRVLERIRSLADEGITIILSTHDPDHAFLCGDRVALLKDGRLVALGPPNETITPQRLNELYGVDVAIHQVGASQETKVCVPTLTERESLH